jgi:hypothetical protein
MFYGGTESNLHLCILRGFDKTCLLECQTAFTSYNHHQSYMFRRLIRVILTENLYYPNGGGGGYAGYGNRVVSVHLIL